MKHSRLTTTEMHPVGPPRLGEKVLAWFSAEPDRDMILGDFAEVFWMAVARFGPRRAHIWYWYQVMRALPALCILMKRNGTRSPIMENGFWLYQERKLALTGLILSIPAMILCLGGILQSGFGITQINESVHFDWFIFHPVLLLGGILAAFTLNLLPVARFRFEDGSLIGTLKLKGAALNLTVIGATLLFAGIIFLYALAENFQVFAR